MLINKELIHKPNVMSVQSTRACTAACVLARWNRHSAERKTKNRPRNSEQRANHTGKIDQWSSRAERERQTLKQN